jgi:hypothetical protein
MSNCVGLNRSPYSMSNISAPTYERRLLHVFGTHIVSCIYYLTTVGAKLKTHFKMSNLLIILIVHRFIIRWPTIQLIFKYEIRSRDRLNEYLAFISQVLHNECVILLFELSNSLICIHLIIG